MLLRSRPDTVQRFLLRETQLSTPLIKGSSINKTSEADHHSCYSGFQVQGAADSPAGMACFHGRKRGLTCPYYSILPA